MQNKSEIRRRIIALFLTILFIGYAGNNILFVHTHIEGNFVITHAHPYSNSHHSHSAHSFEVISALNYAISNVAAFLFFVAVAFHLLRIVEYKVSCFRRNIIHFNLSLRAPPTV